MRTQLANKGVLNVYRMCVIVLQKTRENLFVQSVLLLIMYDFLEAI